MNIPEAVIARFFRGECNEAEEQEVKLYFIQHPGELEKYMTEESWEHTESYLLPGSVSADMLANIERATGKRKVIGLPRTSMAAAAVLVLMLGAGWLWMQQTNPTSAISQSANVADAVEQRMVTRTNTTGKPITIQTRDGSSMVLEAGSSVSFYEPFRNSRRDFYLKGNALFTVASDKKQPFTVFAGKLATTVLGTVFRVQETHKGAVQVRLYSGKVKVNPVTADSNAVVYLKPGQELMYGENGGAPVVKNFTEKQAETRVVKAKPVMTQLSFANEPLKDIFDKLIKEKGIQIQYNSADLTDMSFTGAFNPAQETLESFIETIALLNGLSVQKEKNIYHINR